jgi:hypothetical protein
MSSSRSSRVPKQQAHIYLRADDRAWLIEEAERLDTSASAIVRDLIRDRRIQDTHVQTDRHLATLPTR